MLIDRRTPLPAGTYHEVTPPRRLLDVGTFIRDNYLLHQRVPDDVFF
jgi:hypothetical protein